MPTSPFILNPLPRVGQGAYGMVPGALGLPQPFSDLAAVYPNLTGTNAAASQALLSKLRGELSPGTINQIQDAAARFGVGAGIPGSGLTRNMAARNIGLTSEQLQREGLSAYPGLMSSIAQTQMVSPALQTEIASQNALYGAAPDPREAAAAEIGLFNSAKSVPQGGYRGAPNVTWSGGPALSTAYTPTTWAGDVSPAQLAPYMTGQRWATTPQQLGPQYNYSGMNTGFAPSGQYGPTMQELTGGAGGMYGPTMQELTGGAGGIYGPPVSDMTGGGGYDQNFGYDPFSTDWMGGGYEPGLSTDSTPTTDMSSWTLDDFYSYGF